MSHLRDSSRYWTPDIPLLDTTKTFHVPGAGAIRWTGRYFWNNPDSLWAEARWDSEPYSPPLEVLLPAGAIDHKGTLRNVAPRRWRIGIGQDLALDSGVLRASRPLMLEGPPNRLVPVAFDNPNARNLDADDESPKLPKRPVLRHGARGLLMFQGSTGPRIVERIDLTRKGNVVVPGKPSRILSRKGGVTISVDPVEANRSPLPALHDSDFRANFRPTSPEGTLEWTAGESGARRLVQAHGAGHAFLDLFVTAWNEHRPVRLSPDAVWSLLLDGYLAAVRADPEKVRKELVLHESGKVDLRTELDQCFPGRLQLRESWVEVASQLLDSMDRHTVDDRHKRLQIRFSTTTPTRALARQFRTLDAYQDFFTYSGGVSCGIPSIRLEGVPEDWKRLRAQVEALRITPTQVWVEGLRPVLDAFVATAAGHPPEGFWSSFVRFLPADPDCGEVDRIDGWISRLVYVHPITWGIPEDSLAIPFDEDLVESSVGVNRVPSDHGQVPFTLIAATDERKFLFVSGFTGVSQDPDGTLSAETGWAVWEVHPTASEAPADIKD